MQQRVELERLGDEVGRALLDRVDRVLHRAEAGDDDRDDLGVTLERGLEHGASVHAGEAEVRDDDVEREIGEPRERLFAAGGLFHDEAVVGQAFRDRLPQRRLVVHEKQMFRVFSHLVRRRYFDTPDRRGQRNTALPALQARAGHSDNIPEEQQLMMETQDHINHEGVRAGRCQPPHHLQLDRQRQGRVRPHGRRLGPHLRGHALARAGPVRRADAQRSVMMPAADNRSRTAGDDTEDLGLLFHRLNNQLGIILANAELLESKSADEMGRARAAQVVSSVLDAMTTAREIRLRVR